MDNQAPPAPRWAGVGLLVIVLGVFVGLGMAFGFLRAAIACVMFVVISLFGSRQVRSMMRFPPDPEIADVSDYGLRYVCTMCGLELKIEKAAKDKAPTHCMEPMMLIRTGGRPPLTPVD